MFANMETIWKHISGRFTTRLPFGLESHSLPNMLFQTLPKLTIDTEHRVNVRARSRSMASSEQRDTVDSLLESALEGEQNETRLVCRKKKVRNVREHLFRTSYRWSVAWNPAILPNSALFSASLRELPKCLQRFAEPLSTEPLSTETSAKAPNEYQKTPQFTIWPKKCAPAIWSPARPTSIE